MPIIDVDFKILDKIDIDFGSFYQWRVLGGGGGYNHKLELVYGDVTFWPAFTIRNLKYIRRFEFIQDDANTLVIYDIGALRQMVNGTELELNKIRFHVQKSYYCHSAGWAQTCNPWGSDHAGHRKSLKSEFNSTSFKAIIVDIEGNNNIFEVPKISDWNFR